MQVKVLASGSSGNCILLEGSPEEIVMLEAGISFKQVRKTLHFNTEGLRCCFITHSHLDHCKYAKDVAKAGIDIYAPHSVFEATKLTHSHRCWPIQNVRVVENGPWYVRPFSVPHDVECFGYFLAYGSERVLFLTDAMYSPVRFNGLTTVILGVNYSRDHLDPNIHPVHRKHIISGHMELQTALDLLKANDLSKCREIHLIHLSDENSNAEYFGDEIRKATGIATYVH